jgi:allantoinase
MTFAIRGQRVVTRDGTRPATIHVTDGRISEVTAWSDVLAGSQLLDAGESLVMPGLVDSHVHVNEPGRTEWEGFATATRAAAAGGITTICDMPLNSLPATTTAAALVAKQEAARATSVVSVEFIGGVVPGNSGELRALRDAGVCAFKCFLAPSGVPEFPSVDERALRQALPILAELGLPLMVHAEDPALLHAGHPSRAYADYLATRPAAAERSAIALMIRLMEWCPTPVHIVHLSSASSLELIRDARTRGLPLTVETCPHYLTFAAEEIPDGATEYKCAPPIRNAAERDGLWAGLLDGEIDLVASDHSPCPPPLKATDGDFLAAWGGIASLQLSLAAVWTGARARGADPAIVAQWMSAAPARLVGLDHRKGALAPGYHADIVVWDPASSFVADPATLFHRHSVTPYTGRTLDGVVRATFARGQLVFGGL